VTQTSGLATEEWVLQQLAGQVVSWNGRTGAVVLTLNDVLAVGAAPQQNPNFTGIPTAPTAVNGTSTSQIATTAFVMNTLTAISPGVITFNTRSGAVTLDATDINNAGGALLNSPNFVGTPAAPTAPAGTATSQIATTAFVMAEIAATTAGVATWNGRTGNVTMNVTDIAAAGGAPAASPALTGVPTAPTAANGTSTQQLATTAFVMNELNAIDTGVTTFNGRSGTVSLTQNDVTAVGGLVNPSPQLTGTPTAPTPAPTDSSTNIATTAFVKAALANMATTTVSGTAPPSPTTGALWYNLTDGQTYVWTGSTWAIAVNPPMPNLALYMPVAGGTFTGPVTLAANAASALQPVTLQQLTNQPTINQPVIVGVTDGAGAAAGDVGEVFGPTTGPNVTLPLNTNQNIGGMELAAGVWVVFGNCNFGPTSGGSVWTLQAGLGPSGMTWAIGNNGQGSGISINCTNGATPGAGFSTYQIAVPALIVAGSGPITITFYALSSWSEPNNYVTAQMTVWGWRIR
jgi:hypothetical protein